VLPLRALFVATLLAVVHPAPAGAEMYKLTAPDGTQHYTNAPTDPRYQRMGFPSGTAAGFLRLPQAESGQYQSEIKDAADRYQVPIKLVSAVIRAESGFNARAVSPKGAQGLMQLMPQTANILGVRNSFDPRENIEGGVRHLRLLLDQYNGNVRLALAAYNAGDGAVSRHGGVPPYPETIEYLQRVLAYRDQYNRAP